MEHDQTSTVSRPNADPEAQLVAFVAGRSVPCPRCGYDLRDIRNARCPECAEPLILKVGSPRASFGWLVLAMVPGCFSGVAATFLLIPIGMTLWHRFPPGPNLPWPVIGADVFGFLSAACVGLMYRQRQRILSRTLRDQATFAACVWLIHILATGLFALAMWYGR